MFRPLAPALILALLLTGIGAGIARGTVQVDGRAVLCSGAAVVLEDHPDGSDRQSAHLCPDMVLALFSAVGIPASADPPRYATGSPQRGSADGYQLWRHRRDASARDPPLTAIAQHSQI